MAEREIKITATGGAPAEAAAETETAVDLPRAVFRCRARFPYGTYPDGITLAADGEEIFSASVPPQDEELLGCETEAALAARLDGASDAGAELLGILVGVREGSVDAKCVTADGALNTLSSGVAVAAPATLLFSLPAEARQIVLTCGGEPAAAADLSADNVAVTESVTCAAAGFAETSEAENASYGGASARSLPALLSPVRTFPPLPPAEKLSAFGGALVTSGFGRVAVYVSGKMKTERAAGNVTGVWAAEDGTLAYVSGGRAFMCRGDADILSAEGDAAVLTGEGNGAVMHVLAGGKVRSLSAGGSASERDSDAIALSVYDGSVAELSAARVKLYSPTGALLSDKEHSQSVSEVAACFDGGFAVVTESGAHALITPFYERALPFMPEGYDGMLVAAESGGSVQVYDASGTSLTAVGGADSPVMAFTDALYSVMPGGKVTRRAALKRRTLLMSGEFAAGESYTVVGTKRSRGAGIAAAVIEGG